MHINRYVCIPAYICIYLGIYIYTHIYTWAYIYISVYWSYFMFYVHLVSSSVLMVSHRSTVLNFDDTKNALGYLPVEGLAQCYTSDHSKFI